MNPERFSPGVRPPERERRARELDGLAEQEVGMARRLRETGQVDAAQMAELFALASSTAEIRAASPALDRIDRSTIQAALAGQI